MKPVVPVSIFRSPGRVPRLIIHDAILAETCTVARQHVGIEECAILRGGTHCGTKSWIEWSPLCKHDLLDGRVKTITVQRSIGRGSIEEGAEGVSDWCLHVPIDIAVAGPTGQFIIFSSRYGQLSDSPSSNHNVKLAAPLSSVIRVRDTDGTTKEYTFDLSGRREGAAITVRVLQGVALIVDVECLAT